MATGLAPGDDASPCANLGGTDPLRNDYLAELESLIRRFDPAWVSDHLCWGAIGGHYAHDLLLLPHTEEAVRHVADRVRQVQDRLGRRILIENVSSYLTYSISSMPEWVFLTAVAEEADCGILLDVNNIYVSAVTDSRRWNISREFPQAGSARSTWLVTAPRETC